MTCYHHDYSYSTDAVFWNGFIPVILQNHRLMLHCTVSYYKPPEILMFPHELIQAVLQSFKIPPLVLLPHPPLTLDAESGINSLSRCCESMWCRQTKLIFLSLSVCTVGWYAEHVVCVHVHCTSLSSIFYCGRAELYTSKSCQVSFCLLDISFTSACVF